MGAVSWNQQLRTHIPVQQHATGTRQSGDKHCRAGGLPWQSNNLSLLLCKGPVTSPFLLPTLTGLGTDQVTWRLSEQLQIQKGIFVLVLNINLEESLT